MERGIAAGERPHIGWQFFAYAVITAGEVMVSITGLEYSYTQAPPEDESGRDGAVVSGGVGGQIHWRPR